MIDTANRNILEELQKKLKQKIKHSRPEMEQAIRDLITAISYKDETLIQSSIACLSDALALLIRDIIDRELKTAELTKQAVRDTWHNFVDGNPLPDAVFDEIRELIQPVIDERIVKMTGIRDELVKRLEELGGKVENAEQLEEGIKAMRLFREIMADWSSPSQEWPALNMQTIRQAREAKDQKEKWFHKGNMVYPATDKDREGQSVCEK